MRLIAEDGEQLGIVPIEEARAISRDRGLDLVEVAANARPPVIKLMDFGKWKYEQAKNAREAKKNEHHITVKQVKYRPFVDDHDFEIKTNQARKFLEQGHKVKVTVMFQRRALRRPESGYAVMNRVAETLQDVAKVEFKPSAIINRDLTMVLAPINTAARGGSAAPASAGPTGAPPAGSPS